MKHYRVKTGYGAEDFISIDETELERAIIAQGTGKVAVFKSGTVSGNHIITIKEDLHKILGVNPLYQLKPEDLNDIPRATLTDHQNHLALVSAKVNGEHIPPPRPMVQLHTKGLTQIGEIKKYEI